MTDLQDKIELRSGRGSNNDRLLIYFIAGNPGLVEYYRRYLEYIQRALQNRQEEVIIFGASHDGFGFHTPSDRINEGEPPYSLAQEIHCVQSRLALKARALRKADDTKNLSVILIGHSVGSYMLLETIEWWQNQPSEQSLYSIKGGICLFPTVVDIIKSDKGQTLRPLLNFPGMGHLLSGLATFCNWIGFLDQLTIWLTPGTEGGAVTAALARSATGVRQVIHMAGDELASINEDKWHAEDLWGGVAHASDEAGAPNDEREASSSIATAPGAPRTRLYLLFGKDDYWVNNNSRDDLISKRGGKHTTMEVLHHRPEIPHTFSLHPEHSDHVGEKTVAWISTLEKEQ